DAADPPVTRARNIEAVVLAVTVGGQTTTAYRPKPALTTLLIQAVRDAGCVLVSSRTWHDDEVGKEGI
ncbi:MAG TPA: hypothetical protein VEO01_34800, partial [Pseudonocardiaceae bacterium]|nr:hypothetical protein [Pseudonocardiaceae bacterium]